MKKVGVIVGIVVVISIIVILIIKLPKTNPTIIIDNNENNELTNLINTKIEHDRLTKITYSNSGDSNGNIDRIELDLDNLTLKTEYKINYSDPLEVKEYKINEEDLKDIKEYVENYNFIAWSNLPIDRDLIVLDAPLKSIVLTYDNTSIGQDKDDTYVINFNTKIPREGFPLLNNLVDKLSSLINSNNLIKEYTNNNEIK